MVVEPVCAAPDPAAASAEYLALIPREFARAHALLSQGRDGNGREIVLHGPASDPAAIHNLAVRLGRPVALLPADLEAVQAAIDRAYEQAQGAQAAEAASAPGEASANSGEEDIARLLEHADRDLLNTAGKAPMVTLVDRLLLRAVHIGASDLHVQPLADRMVVRHRVDGVLDDGIVIPQRLHRPLVSRIKVMGRMDVAEHLVPQDGRASVQVGARLIDLRISSLPTAYGERVVVRLLDSARQLCRFDQLGMPERVAVPFLTAARHVNGIILVTGPTGSGKTTTLYATLRELDSRERNIMTIEDPIEYELDTLGLPISQSQVNDRKGVNFANGLRHILRQDPDIIMVGEIRDAETARIAIQSSLTGHLVLSTLHTNDAVSAVTRLIDLGVEPYLVSASLSAVLAQRLVRTRCRACSRGPLDQAPDPTCPACQGSGWKGRTGIFELLTLSESLRSLINAGRPVDDLRRQAQEEGMTILADEGRRLVAAGATTAVEVERVVHG